MIAFLGFQNFALFADNYWTVNIDYLSFSFICSVDVTYFIFLSKAINVEMLYVL